MNFLTEKGLDVLSHSNSNQEKVANNALHEGESVSSFYDLSGISSCFLVFSSRFDLLKKTLQFVFLVMSLKRLLIGSISLSEDSQPVEDVEEEQSTEGSQSTGRLDFMHAGKIICGLTVNRNF